MKIMLLECSAPHWIGVVKRLEVAGIEVAHWTAWQYSRDAIVGAFPNTRFHDTLDAKRGLNESSQEPRLRLFDSACEQVWREDAQVIYDQMNRFDHSRDMNMVDRTSLFLRQIGYWRERLEDVKPDLVVFPAPPHVVYDYVVLCLCRALNIPTLMFEEATIFPPYSIAMRDFIGSALPLQAPVDATPISPESRQIVEKLRGEYRDAKPQREVEAHEARDKALHEGLGKVRDMRRKAALAEFLGKELKVVNQAALYKERGKSLQDSFKGKYAGTRYFNQLVSDWKLNRKFAALYSSLSTSQGQAPAVYVPLAGQPERTSNPQAGVYTNQLLMVSAIAQAIPRDWSVWVKEHPNQFHPQFAVNMCRSEEYYRMLASIPKVQILPTDFDPFTAIDQASVVATSGGTAALEAVARGKPALLFGDAWYRDCPGVFRVRSSADVQALFSQPGQLRVPSGAIEQFVERVCRNGFIGIADYPPSNYPVQAEENEKNLAVIITNSLTGKDLLDGLTRAL